MGQRDITQKTLESYNDIFAHPQEVFEAISAISGDSRYEEIFYELPESERGGATMCRFLDEKLEEGMEKGMEKGAAQRLVEMIDSIMKNSGKSAKEACSLADVSVQEYRKWKKKLSY